MADCLCIHVQGCFWRRPTCFFLPSVAWLALRKQVPCVVKMNGLLEALEIAIVSVGFDEFGIRPLIDVSQRWNLHAAIVCRGMLHPICIGDRRPAQKILALEKRADAEIDVRGSIRVSDITEVVRMVFLVIGQKGIGRRANIACREIREEWLLAGTTVAMASVAVGLAAEKVVALVAPEPSELLSR